MIFLRINVLILFFVHTLPLAAQLRYYTDPLKTALSLSGNFGELRADHFHTGLDFRTQRKTGFPVYASAEGYVSRIVVSPTGFGRALYINHPNNTTTVYGHLLRFRSDIEDYVAEEQYRRRSFAVDLQLSPGRFTAARQEQIGLSGNSGSSGGPHLHYEIRDTPTQDALNPLHINNFNIPDHTSPRIRSVRFYPLDSLSHVEFMGTPLTRTPQAVGNLYSLPGGQVVKAWGRIGVALQSNDYFDNNGSPCGIFEASLAVDGTERFRYELSRVAFSLNRYLNSHIDYGEYAETGNRYVKMWLEPGNRIPLYTTDTMKGILAIDSGKIYRGEVRLKDVAGNQSVFRFQIAGFYREMPVPPSCSLPRFRHNAENRWSDEEFEIITPAGAFYDDFPFRYERSERTDGFFSVIHRVHRPAIPVHKAVTIRIKTAALPEQLRSKALVAEISREGLLSSAGGSWSEGWMQTTIRSFGSYSVALDTLPPVITPLSIKENALTEPSRIRFTITDDLAGIKEHTGLIDDQWVLFEYDPKNSLLFYRIDSKRLQTGKRHTLLLKVTDQVDNESVYRATFWK